MKPEIGDYILRVPLTFDSPSKQGGLPNERFYFSLLVMFLWLLVSIFILVAGSDLGLGRIFYPILLFFACLYVCRFVIMKEHYFYKKREELKEHDYHYAYNLFWNIYEVSASYPYICRYVNGLKAIFVVFDKDVIVGREENNDYNHCEAISEAYLQMARHGIDCVHIDYMDSVGKDERVQSLFELANGADNDRLRELLVHIFDNVDSIMQHSYTSYDVYAFLYTGKDELFIDDLDTVIGQFMEGNYIRYRILGKEDLSNLVKPVMNLNKFSVTEASERLFSDFGGTHYLTPIWVERDTERKILNKTSEEKEEERKVIEVEQGLKKSRRTPKTKEDKLLQKYKETENINLFEDESSNDYYNSSNPYPFNSQYSSNEETGVIEQQNYYPSSKTLQQVEERFNVKGSNYIDTAKEQEVQEVQEERKQHKNLDDLEIKL